MNNRGIRYRRLRDFSVPICLPQIPVMPFVGKNDF